VLRLVRALGGDGAHACPDDAEIRRLATFSGAVPDDPDDVATDHPQPPAQVLAAA
jgi:hypothetical protein